MATRTISASLTSPTSATLTDGDEIYYSGNPDHSGVVSSGEVLSAYLTLTNFRVYAGSCYLDVYIDGTKVGETVEMDTDDYGGGETTTVEVEMEYLEDDILTATGEIQLVCHNNRSSSANTFGVRSSGEATISVEYTAPGKCSAPTSVTIDGSSSQVTTGNSTAKLAWSGAKGGSNNSIAGYVIMYRDSSDGSSWGSWYSYGEKDISSTSSSGSLTVNLGSIGNYRQFRVATFGKAGKDYMSGYKSSPVVFRTRTACTPPTSVSLAATSSTGSNVRLSWSGASAGVGNQISGYEVQRRESTNNSSWGSWSTVGTTTNTYLDVAPPATAGNYYQYQVRTLGSAGADYNSGWKTSSNTLRRSYTACGAPTACAVDSALSLVATTLRWSGATAGYGNPISKYEVQRRSKAPGGSWSAWSAFETTSGTSLSVSPPTTAGHYYQYQVRAQGTAGEAYYSDWKESTNTLRKAHKTIPAFTDPTLIVGQTDVKAVHITELQNALNDILLPFMGVSKVTFTELERDSDAKHWGAHVQEIKNAIDSTGVSHEVWITMQDEVTADVVEQLRRIVKSM